MKKRNLSVDMQQSVNIEFYHAIMNPEPSIAAILKTLENGATPFGYLSVPNNPTLCFVKQMFLVCRADVIEAILNFELENGNKLDLRKYPFDNKAEHGLNFFQGACFDCDESIVQALYKYALNTRIDIDKMINARIIWTDPTTGKENSDALGPMLIRTIDNIMIAGNKSINYSSAAELNQATDFFSKWRLRDDEEPPISVSKPIKIIYKGPMVIGFLLSIGLDIKALGADPFSFADQMAFITENSKSLKGWSEIVSPLLQIDKSLENVSQPFSIRNKVIFIATLRNRLGFHPVKFEITVDFTELNNVVQNALRVQQDTNPTLKPLVHAFAQHKQEFVALKDVVEDITEVRRKAVQKHLAEHPNVLTSFNILNSMVKNYFDARNIASTKLFDTRTVTPDAMIAKTAVAFVAMVSQSASFPGANLIPAFMGLVVEWSTQSYANKQSNGVVNATLGADTDRIAVDIAAVLAAQIFLKQADKSDFKLANDLAALVIKAIDKLHKYTFIDQNQVLAFLCEPAMQHLGKVLRYSPTSSSASTGSNKSRKDGVMVVAIEDEDTSYKKKATSAGACCTIC